MPFSEVHNRDRNNHGGNNRVPWKGQVISFLSQKMEQRKSSALKPRPFKSDERLKIQSALSVSVDGSMAAWPCLTPEQAVLVPSLLKDLPAETRDAVKQVPINVGF